MCGMCGGCPADMCGGCDGADWVIACDDVDDDVDKRLRRSYPLALVQLLVTNAYLHAGDVRGAENFVMHECVATLGRAPPPSVFTRLITGGYRRALRRRADVDRPHGKRATARSANCRYRYGHIVAVRKR